MVLDTSFNGTGSATIVTTATNLRQMGNVFKYLDGTFGIPVVNNSANTFIVRFSASTYTRTSENVITAGVVNAEWGLPFNMVDSYLATDQKVLAMIATHPSQLEEPADPQYVKFTRICL